MYVFVVVMSANIVGHGVWELLVGWQKVGCRRKGKLYTWKCKQSTIANRKRIFKV